MGTQLVDLARKFCTHYHNGQFRKGSNEPYDTHPFAVADILECNGYADDITQCIAILHDTTEDTELRHREIREVFGFEIANGVYILDKNTIDDGTMLLFNQMTGTSLSKATVYKMRIRLAREKIQRCKIADSIHNTRDLVNLRPQSIEEKINDAEQFYIPLGQIVAPIMVQELARNIANYREKVLSTR